MMHAHNQRLGPSADPTKGCLEELHYTGNLQKLLEELMQQKERTKQRRCFQMIRDSIPGCIEIVGGKPVGRTTLGGIPVNFECRGVLYDPKPPATPYGKSDELCVAGLMLDVPKKPYSGALLGEMQGRPVYCRCIRDRHLPMSYDAGQAMSRMAKAALDETGKIMRWQTAESRARGLDEACACLAFVKVPSGRDKENIIVGVIAFDRRPIVEMPEAVPVSTKTVYDMLASGHAFDVGTVLYLLVCRTHEHSLRAYDMGAFCDALDGAGTIASPCFKALCRELQPLYVADAWKDTNKEACAKVLARALAHHAAADQRQVDAPPVNYRNVVLEIFHAGRCFNNQDGDMYLAA